MSFIYDHKAPKKPTHLSINSDLLKKARELDINLSSGLEADSCLHPSERPRHCFDSFCLEMGH